MKKPYIIDECKIFQVDLTQHKLSTKTIGDYTAVIVDNFYTNPEMVRDLALSVPPSFKDATIGTAVPGEVNAVVAYRASIALDLSSLDLAFVDFFRNWFRIAKCWSVPSIRQRFRELVFDVNIAYMDKNLNKLQKRGIPHQDAFENIDMQTKQEEMPDECGIAGLVTLNTPEECQGGTAFYTYNGMQAPNETDYEGDWKLLEVIEMKWNRLIIYPNFILHTPYITDDMHFDGKPIYRLNQAIFP